MLAEVNFLAVATATVSTATVSTATVSTMALGLFSDRKLAAYLLDAAYQPVCLPVMGANLGASR